MLEATNQPTNQSINQSINQSVNQSINQSYQSVNQLRNQKKNSKSNFLEKFSKCHHRDEIYCSETMSGNLTLSFGEITHTHNISNTQTRLCTSQPRRGVKK